MKTIEQRAEEYANTWEGTPHSHFAEECFIAGATDQRKIDTERAKEAFDKAVGWCRTYRWYQGVCDEFFKALEGGE